MNTKLQRKTKVRALVAAVAMGLGILAAAAPQASANVLDTDHPRDTGTHIDFGEHWLVSAPRDGGDLLWDLVDGYTTPKLTGYLYLTDETCGKVQVLYYDDDHDYLGLRESSRYCAPGNGKVQYWIDLHSFNSLYVSHVHVKINRQNSDGSYTTIDTAFEDFD
jgi:hypothetical protein